MKMSGSVRFFLSLFLVSGGYFLLAHLPVGGAPLVEITLAQYIAFPCIILILWRFVPEGFKIPGVVLFLAGLLACVGATYAYSLRVFSPVEVFLARLSSDELEVSTRIFRERLNKSLRGQTRMRIHRYYRSFDTHEALETLFEREAELKAAVWGSKGWVQISFPFRAKRYTSAVFRAERFEPEFLVINNIAAVGMTRQPEKETTDFISAILLGGIVSRDHDQGRGSSARALRESYLQSAADMASTWSSFAHRAYPELLIGNHYLDEYLKSDGFVGDLDCASAAYSRGYGHLRPFDNPELRSALSNNKGIALLVNGLELEDVRLIKQARWHFKQAVGFMGRQSRFGASNRAAHIAAINLQNVSELLDVASRKGEKKEERERARKAGKKSYQERKSVKAGRVAQPVGAGAGVARTGRKIIKKKGNNQKVKAKPVKRKAKGRPVKRSR